MALTPPTPPVPNAAEILRARHAERLPARLEDLADQPRNPRRAGRRLPRAGPRQGHYRVNLTGLHRRLLAVAIGTP
ncbi:hypothetical protein [Streptomyces sp. MNP-20]|uniref:hypothetical protein n=1 Tax=Streptomyces sp. MNP-20 TaxID=2721165 RepID=UPI0015574BC2|nr:hypothetical protein [Streptomyces sp. MNP-20]